MTTLVQVSETQSNKAVTVNENFEAVAASGLFGVKRELTVGLTFAYYGGIIYNGAAYAAIADGTLSLPASQAAVYIEVTQAGVVSQNTSAFTAGRTPLYLATTSSSGITALTDYRTLIPALSLISGFNLSTLTIATGSIASSTPALTITQTWASGSPTEQFIAADMNITDTSSLAGSILQRWRVGGTAIMSLVKEGQLQLPTQGIAGGLLLGGDAQLYRSAADTLRTPDSLTVDGTLVVGAFSPTAITIATGSIVSSAPALTITQTWASGSPTEQYIGVDMNITDTSSLSTSLLQRWRVGGASVMELSKGGQLSLTGGDLKLLTIGAAIYLTRNSGSSNLKSLYYANATDSGVGDNLFLTNGGGDDVYIKANSAIQARFVGTASTTFYPVFVAGTSASIILNTSDASDNGALFFVAGGAVSASRGASIELYGNEHASVGALNLRCGTATGGTIQLFNANSVRTFLYNTHASAPYGFIVQYTSAAPNGTDNEFIYFVDNASARAYIRSNGGFANFQANDVNLSDMRVKMDFLAISSAPDLMAKLWSAHKKVDWGFYKYTDQTHDDPNFGYSAQGVAAAFADVAPWLVDQWEPGKSDKLGVYSADLQSISAAVLTQAQVEIDDLKEWKVKATAALEAEGITIN